MKKVNNLFNAGYGWGRTYPLKIRLKTGLKEESIGYSKEYLYLEALEDGMTVSFTKKVASCSLYYSLNKQEWNELTGETPAVNSGEKVYFKVDNLDTELHNGIGTFTINKQCIVAGNAMSLIFADEFVDKTDLSGYDYVFSNVFSNCTTIQSAKNLILPATTLANDCYSYMFAGCTGLTTAPELPAATLKEDCYYYMFISCTNLNYIKMLATDISASGCLNYWVPGVSSTGTFVKADGVEIPTGVSGIPEGWTVQTA